MAGWDPLVNEIFLRAIEAGSPAERAAVLETSCRDDAELRRKVGGPAAGPRRRRKLPGSPRP